MKKTAFLLLGLVAFSGAVMFHSNASRMAYHEYLRAQSFNGNSAGKNSNIEAQLSAASDYRETRHFHRLNYLFPTYNKREFYSQVSPTPEQFTDRPIKTVSLRKGFFQQSTSATKSISTQAITIREKFDRQTTDTFSVEVPQNWETQSNAESVIASADNGTLIRIEALKDINCASTLSFEICGRNIMTTQNRVRAKEMQINAGKIINAEANIFDNELGNRTTYNFYEQTQLATHSKTNLVIMNRLVENSNGELYILEIIAPETKASYAVSMAKKIFDTFRIK